MAQVFSKGSNSIARVALIGLVAGSLGSGESFMRCIDRLTPRSRMCHARSLCHLAINTMFPASGSTAAIATPPSKNPPSREFLRPTSA